MDNTWLFRSDCSNSLCLMDYITLICKIIFYLEIGIKGGHTFLQWDSKTPVPSLLCFFYSLG